MIDTAKVISFSKKDPELCKGCKFLERTFVPLHSYGEIKPNKVVIVGEAPGWEEAKQRIPFIGKSGQLLRECLRDVGFTDDEFIITNVIKCHPPDNATPDDDSIEKCANIYLFRELECLKPLMIIALGAVACKGLGILGQITKIRGEFTKFLGISVLPTFHPAYVLRNDNQMSTFKSDLRQAYNFIHKKIYFTEESCLVIKDSRGLDELEEFYKTAKANKSVLAVDIETNNMLDPTSVGSSLVCVGLSNGKRNYSVMVNHPYVLDLKFRQNALALLKRILSDKSIGKVGHNFVFDIKWLVSRGIEVEGISGDTMVMSHLINENKLKHDLETLVREHFGEYRHNFNLEDIDELGLYNCEDVYYTHKLYELFWKKLADSTKNLLENTISNAIPVLAQMELEGVGIDLEYARELSRICDVKKQGCIITLNAMGFRNINLNSNDQLASVIFDKLGEKPERFTPTGKRCMDDAVISKFEEQGKEWAKALTEYKRLTHFQNTYINKFLELASGDGRVRGKFKLTGTVTGRLSSREPNLQNIPVDKQILRMFVPENGYKFFYFDFSQAELKVGCSIANERTMIKMFNEGKDIHTFTAAKIMGKREADVTKEDRQKAKAVNFGFLYGAQAATFQHTAKNDYGLDLPLSTCEKFRDAFFRTFSDFESWYERTRYEITHKGYIEYPTGRFRHFGRISRSDKNFGEIFRQAINSPVQGSSSDIVLLTMGELYKIIKKRNIPAKFLLTVHDSVMLEIWDKEEVEEELRGYLDLVLKDIVPSKCKWLKVPMTVEARSGYSWDKVK